MNLLRAELRRALHRRVVRVLVIIAVVGCALFGVIVWVSSAGKTLAELRADNHPALVASWWRQDLPDGVPIVVSLFLFVGAAIAGASVAGAEWRANTVTTMLTWEPRRLRVLGARLAAAVIVAFVVAVLLQALFILAAVPSVIAHGSTSTPGGGWWWSLTLALLRMAALTAMIAVMAEALAMLGRNTAFALVALFGWIAVVESVVRGLRPGWARWLWGENLATVVPWRAMGGDEVFYRGPLTALLTLCTYAGLIAVAAAVAFHRRDIGASA